MTCAEFGEGSPFTGREMISVALLNHAFCNKMDADMATEHSKQCCERLAEGGAVNKLLMLIQTVNRSPPHEQVLKHALSILANLARFPNLAFSIAGEADSINIIVEQLLIFR